MAYRIAVIPGDGIGPEIVAEAKKVLDTIGKKYGHFVHQNTNLRSAPALQQSQNRLQQYLHVADMLL